MISVFSAVIEREAASSHFRAVNRDRDFETTSVPAIKQAKVDGATPSYLEQGQGGRWCRSRCYRRPSDLGRAAPSDRTEVPLHRF